jgi:hypothetical protein
MIRRYYILLRIDCHASFTKEQATKAFTGMEELTIEVWQAQFWNSDYEALTRFEGVRGVRRVKIIGSISQFKGFVEWLRNTMMMPVGSIVDGFEEDPVKHISFDVELTGSKLHTGDFNEVAT